MSSSLTAGVISVCLFAAVWIGLWLRRLVPKHHFSAETRDTVKLAMGLVATMSALVLGLLVSSAKSSYDTTRGQVIQMASKIALLDRALGVYGPEATELRRQLRILIEEQMRRMWPDEATSGTQPRTDTRAGDAFYVAIQSLSPRDDTQRTLKTQAATLAGELGQLRALMLAESTTSISRPMLIVVVAWLVVIFLSFSLLAPSNATANLALMVSALSVVGALFLVLELDRPFGGLIQISSEPMRIVISNLEKWGL
jgi:hypothetical protein